MDATQKQEIEEKVKNLLDLRIRPLLQQDGGDVVFRELKDDGEVKVELTGACNGCPNAIHTLRDVIENTVKYFIPEVTSVTNIEAE